MRCPWCCRSELAAATQKRLEEAAAKKKEEDAQKAAQRHVRKEYKCAYSPSHCLYFYGRLWVIYPALDSWTDLYFFFFFTFSGCRSDKDAGAWWEQLHGIAEAVLY